MRGPTVPLLVNAFDLNTPSYVQINIYGITLEGLHQQGVDVKSFLVIKLGRPTFPSEFLPKLRFCGWTFLLCVICRSEEDVLLNKNLCRIYWLMLISVDYQQLSKEKELLENIRCRLIMMDVPILVSDAGAKSLNPHVLKPERIQKDVPQVLYYKNACGLNSNDRPIEQDTTAGASDSIYPDGSSASVGVEYDFHQESSDTLHADYLDGCHEAPSAPRDVEPTLFSFKVEEECMAEPSVDSQPDADFQGAVPPRELSITPGSGMHYDNAEIQRLGKSYEDISCSRGGIEVYAPEGEEVIRAVSEVETASADFSSYYGGQGVIGSPTPSFYEYQSFRSSQENDEDQASVCTNMKSPSDGLPVQESMKISHSKTGGTSSRRSTLRSRQNTIREGMSNSQEETEQEGKDGLSEKKKRKTTKSLSTGNERSQYTFYRCEMPLCLSTIAWHPKVGRNRLVDHARIHWGKEVKKCKLCDFKALNNRKIHHHHSRVHSGLLFTGAISTETKEDERELYCVYEKCFPEHAAMYPIQMSPRTTSVATNYL